jgi:hypothetical protein
MPAAPVQDETVAMFQKSRPPTAPIAFRPTAHPQHGTPLPANVRTRPPSVAPAPMARQPSSLPPPANLVAPETKASGVLGLVLFAAPLAFATVAVAVLAFL